jgi:gliding motility-associated-like protein
MDKIAINDILKLGLKALILNIIFISVIHAQVVPPKPTACPTPTTPVLTSLISMEGGASIKFKNIVQNQKYDLQVAVDNGANYTWEPKGQTTDGIFSISSLDKSKKYCYRVSSSDSCGTSVYSNVVCDIGINSKSSSSSQTEVTWSLPTIPSGIPQNMKLLRDVKNCNNCVKPLPLFSNLDRKFNDESLECSEIYTYQIVTKYSVVVNGVVEIISIESEKIVVNLMDASVEIIPNGLIQAGFPNNDDSMIRLILLDNSKAEKYTFFHKTVEDQGFVEIGKTKANSFNDISIQANSGEYCYKYQVEDACGITSEISPEFCTVFLTYQGTTLNWTDFSFPITILTSTPAEYTVESFDENIGAFLPQFKTSNLSKGVGLLIQDSDNPTIKFRILAQQFIDIPGFVNFSIPSYSNTIVIPIPADIFIPSAFSPNGDGQNETFQIKSKFVEDGTITIYDRWGSILFSGSLDGLGWDGNSPNSMVPLPCGNYTYRIKGQSLAGEKFSRNGILTLLK